MTDYQDLKNCWSKSKAEKGPDDLAYNFYQTLFYTDPETQALFPNDILAKKKEHYFQRLIILLMALIMFIK